MRLKHAQFHLRQYPGAQTHHLGSQLLLVTFAQLPQMELGVFEGVARVMTAKELQAFKAAFEAADRRANMPSPQLASGGEKKSNNQAFVI